MLIRKIESNEIQSVKELVLEVFMQFEAPDYGKDGVQTFKEISIDNDEFMASLEIFGAYIDNRLVGVIATRNEGKHIALFFVKGEYHRHGVGKALFKKVQTAEMTVNASPYAKKVYEHFGFIATDTENSVGGVRFIPMKYCGKKLSDMTLDELWHLFPIELTEPNPKWAEYYAETERKLASLLKSFQPKINHIGSTAIQGIRAKPIVDVLVEMKTAQELNSAAEILAENGFVVMSSEDKRISLNFGYTEKGFAQKVYHIHLRLSGDRDEVYFKDYLNENPTVAKEYEALKLKLRKQFEFNRDGYTMAKTEFIKKYTDIAKHRGHKK